MTAKLTAALLIAIYIAAGRLCFATDPWGAPTPHAKWAAIVQRDDPRPFWLRLLTSLRYDFLNKDIRGGADF